MASARQLLLASTAPRGTTPILSLNFAGSSYFVLAGYVRANYFLNAAAPVTQTITLPVGSYFTNITGSGSAAVAAGSATITGAGSATAAAYLNFSVTVAGTVTVTIAGGPTTVHVGNGHYPSTFINTGATAVSVTTYASSNPADVGDLTYTRSGPAYAPDSAGNLIPFADGVIRITSQGYWAEEARTNTIRNNAATGAATGSPGTLPTNWTQGADAALGTITRTIVGTGVSPFGLKYIDIRFQFTATGAGRVAITPDVAVAGPGAGSSSAWMTILSGNTGSITNTPNLTFRDSADVVLLDSYGTAVTFVGTNRTYLSYTATAPALTAKADVRFGVSVPSAGTYDLTVRYEIANFEAGSFATTPIPTTSGPVTRAADVGYYTIPSLSTAYTLAAVGSSSSASGNYPTLMQLDGGTDGNRAWLFGIPGASTAQGGVRVDVAFAAQINTTVGSTFANGATFGMALSVQASRMAGALNGSSVTAGSGTVPTVNVLRLGLSATGAANLNGPLAKTAVWSSALSDPGTTYVSPGNY